MPPPQVDTNIVIFRLSSSEAATAITEALKAKGVLISGMGPGVLRLVTHLDLTDEDVERAAEALGSV